MKKIFINIFLWYLRTAARIQLWKIRPKIIALTGSVGKTSLRNAIFAVLKDNFKVKKSIKANSETGLPLDILGLHPQDYSFFDWLRLSLLIPLKLLTNWQKYDYYIAELGVDEPFPPKNMEYLLSFIHPNIAIFLNVALVHTQQFEKAIPKNKTFSSNQTREEFLTQTIAQEKGKIITFLSADKIAIVNNDDPLVMEQAKKCKANMALFGHNNNIVRALARTKDNNKLLTLDYARVRRINNYLLINQYFLSLQETSFSFIYNDQEILLKFPYLLPEYYAYTFAAAILTGLSLGLDLTLITNHLSQNFVLPPGRMSIFKGIKNTTIIDSSYNASKISTLGALELLKMLKTSRKKVFVFGDMRELGNQAKSEHEAIAKEVLKTVDQLILIGPLTQQYVLPLTQNKLPTHWFPNSWQAAKWLKNSLRGQEIILVKGSQNTIFTEIVVETLLADKNDVSKLCRRGKFWDKQRKIS